MDRIQLVAVVSALVLDVMVLGAMVGPDRRSRVHPEPRSRARPQPRPAREPGRDRLAVGRFLTGRITFHRLERWQTSYLPVFALWAVTVVAALPPLFGFT
jgi:hypothetical protein